MSWPIRFEGLIKFHYSGLSDLRVSIKLCRLSIGAVTPNWLSNLILHRPIVLTQILTNTISPYIFVVNSPIDIKIKIIDC